MPVIATAGHVDHGKSTLVQALTGTDPDRLREEKERGLTIDLGFAWTEIDGVDIGFVDVPGHEKFIRNMLAGVGAVDCAVLVVAADSGWMPQTEEHAAVLDLLEVPAGIIAVTRIDLVDDDTLELATLEILEEIAGTRLEGWPVVAVSAVDGTGLDDIRAAIADAVAASPPAREAPARMWIDRTFTIAGAGQVVTGTVMDGTITLGDELVTYPSGTPVRVRGLHHHGGSVDEVRTGDRAAIDVAGGPATPGRGELVAPAGSSDVTDRLLAFIQPARYIDEIPPRGAFHIHIGTTSRPARVRRVADDIFLVDAETALPASFGDRIILRDAGRKAVVGGGRVIDTRPQRPVEPSAAIRLVEALHGDADEAASTLVDVHESVSDAWITATTRGGAPDRAVRLVDGWVSEARADAVAQAARALVGEYHEQNPTRPGIPKAELASRLGVSSALLDAVVARTGDLVEGSGAVAAAGFSNELSAEEDERWERVRAELEQTFDVPRLRSLDLAPETVHFLIRRGDLVKVADDLVFTAGQVAAIDDRVAELPDGFTVAEFRDHFGMARRQAVPTLEWLDSIGRTRRAGDGRTVRKR